MLHKNKCTAIFYGALIFGPIFLEEQ